MFHELIEPRKKTNKAISSRNTKTIQDKTFSDQFAFELSDCENKEAESSSTTTFIPPWLRNSLGLNQRNNHSHAATTDQKSSKTIHRYKGPSQNEFEPLKPNVDGDCCKKTVEGFETLSSCGPPEETLPANAEVFNSGDKALPPHWQLRLKDSCTDSSCVYTETKSFEKEESKMADMFTLSEMSKLKDEEKKKSKFTRQRSKTRKRSGSEQKTLTDLNRNDAELETKAKEMLLPKNPPADEVKQLETRLLLLNRNGQNAEDAAVNPQELRLLQDMKEQVGRMRDFDQFLEQVQEANMRDVMKNPEHLGESAGEKKAGGKGRESMQNYIEDGTPIADKDSLLSTDDENDIKRFSEFLSKNKNAEEKRKCLEEVRNYFERKRRTRLSKRRYLEDVKSKCGAETDRKEEYERKDKIKCKELLTMMQSRGKKSKFALCDEEVVEKAVDETLQKFVELYHFHVSPKVMGNMKKNILQAMQSDSVESCTTKLNVNEAEEKREEEKGKAEGPKEPQKVVTRLFPGQQSEIPEVPNQEPAEIPVHKEVKKKTFKTLIIGSNERVQKPTKEIDVVENERLRRLNLEFENFLHSIQNHIEVSNLKIQSIILEKDEHGSPSKHGQIIYNFSKKSLETEKIHCRTPREPPELESFREAGVQASIKREPLKKSVRVQVVQESQKTFEQCLQTDEKIYVQQSTQTEPSSVPFRELKELKSFEISPGLYRMVKSREAGKFYLYPEEMDSSKGQDFEKSTSAVLKDRKYNRKRELLNILSKERTKERRIYFRERDKGKFKRSKKSVFAVANVRAIANKKEKQLALSGVERGGRVVNDGNSVNCLYFRDLEGKNPELMQPTKDLPPKKGSADVAGETLSLGEAKANEHLGCVWFWNGKKISPGCDLKTHVEDLLKEKLKEITEISESLQLKTMVNDLTLTKENGGPAAEERDSQKNVKNPSAVFCLRSSSGSQKDVKNPSAVFCLRTSSGSQKDVKKNASTVLCLRNPSGIQKESQVGLTNEVGSLEAINKAEGKKSEEREEVKETRLSASQEKIVRNVATQNSQQTILSLNLAKTKTQSKMILPKKKHKKQARPHRKFLNFKRAEEIIRAVEEIKYLRRQLENPKRDDKGHSESLLGVSSSSSSTSKNDLEDPLSLMLGLRNGQKPNSKTILKKMITLADHQVQTTDPCEPEDFLSEESAQPDSALDNERHLELIEDVLGRVNQKERENLWNDVRQFIKSKIGRDINDEGAREVCIEIEQDMPEHENDTVRQAVLARGHYVRNEGDVEVEIDLTLEDLEKILRKRQKRIRRQHVYRQKNKRFLSSSSFQSDLTKDEVRKCQKYLNRFATLGGGFLTEELSSSPKKNKGN